MSSEASLEAIPTTILGGSDGKAGALPRAAQGLHSLAVYKGAAIQLGGRPLVAHLVAHLTESGGFGPVSIAGPARVYEPLGLDCGIVDTDGTVAENLRAAIESSPRSGDGHLAILSCDVLPSAEELRTLRAHFGDAGPRALWFPFVPLSGPTESLGAFGWKPVYRLVPRGGDTAVPILPGHLCIFDPDALDLALLYRLLACAYRTRNRSITARRAALVRMGLLTLLGEDLARLVRLRPPSRTATVVSSGIRLARRLARGELEQRELERLIGRIFLHDPRGPGIRYPLIDVLSLAQDIDTEEEAMQLRKDHPVKPAEARDGGI